MEETLGTAAKQMVVLARHPLASGASVISAVGVALTYFVAARLSLALLEPVDGVAVFWPAAGVASGILIALGSAARWPVVVGLVAATIAANLLGDRNICRQRAEFVLRIDAVPSRRSVFLNERRFLDGSACAARCDR